MSPDAKGMAVPPQLALIHKLGSLQPHTWSTGLILRGAALLGLADHLADGPRTGAELAEATGTHPPSLARFLRACAMVGVVERVGSDSYALAETGRLLVSDGPSLRAFVIAVNGPGLMRPWEQVDQALRTGRSVAVDTLGTDLWSYYARHPAEAFQFLESTIPVSRLTALLLTSLIDLSGVGTVVDVGGCPGVMLADLLDSLPAARGVLLDLPAMIPHAEKIIGSHPAADRITFTGGDFLASVPEGGDLYLLKHILGDCDEDAARTVVGHCFAAGAPGSRLLLVDWVTSDEPSFAQVTDIDAMVCCGGRIRTGPELIEMLAEAGYRQVRRLAVPGQENDPLAIIEAVRP
ncbi:acetylserotonin O-methyltransferase [Nonomuraea sp. NBC_01738]|uniref:methyltransferase n=1 Tax=Nonomuraea sp. NBC_01738 TaxID=2976003 RepID=UPI002E10AB63|nr:acetylserotonin O-methyltransferase [Nonomuraea sp. NBC_01738]